MKRARALRRNSTQAETKLWSILRNRQFQHVKFRRQQPIGPYFADFVCFEHRLIVEVDGGQHTDEGDAVRTERLQAQGFRVIRFWNNDVLTNPEGVALKLSESLRDTPHPAAAAADLSRKGRG